MPDRQVGAAVEQVHGDSQGGQQAAKQPGCQNPGQRKGQFGEVTSQHKESVRL